MNRPNRHINMKKADKAACLVVGCDRPALYRARPQTQRGYCREHRPLAVEAQNTRTCKVEWSARHES